MPPECYCGSRLGGVRRQRTATVENTMYLKQFIRDESGCASYLVGSSHAGCCAVIDPQWEVEPYLRAAAAKGLRVTHVLETHLHADHVSGGRRLAERTGAQICIHPPAGGLRTPPSLSTR